jgi:hypothetical protein
MSPDPSIPVTKKEFANISVIRGPRSPDWAITTKRVWRKCKERFARGADDPAFLFPLGDNRYMSIGTGGHGYIRGVRGTCTWRRYTLA